MKRLRSRMSNGPSSHKSQRHVQNYCIGRFSIALVFVIVVLLNYHILSKAAAQPRHDGGGGGGAPNAKNERELLVPPQTAKRITPPASSVRGDNALPQRHEKHPVGTEHSKNRKRWSVPMKMTRTAGGGDQKSVLAPGYADSYSHKPYTSTSSTATTTTTTRTSSLVAGSPTAWQVLHEPWNNATTTIIKLYHTHATTCPNTIVTAYFNVKSKYKADKYDEWMAHILSLQDCLVVYTEPASVASIQRLRTEHPTVIVVQNSTHDLPVSKLYRDTHPSFWADQLAMDKEQKRHASYQLFWIWLSKSWWITQAVHRNFFQSDFFMYSDIGCFRSAAWNNRTLIQHADIVPANKVMWMAHHKPNPPLKSLWNDKFREKQNFYHSGSQGAGTATAWLRFHDVFSQTMDRFAGNQLFLGEDQCILQSACVSAYSTGTRTEAGDKDDGVCVYAPFDQVPDNHYFGLRHVLNRGGDHYTFWHPPILDSA